MSEKKKNSLNELKRLLEEDIHRSESKFKLSFFSDLFFIRLIIRFTVYITLILLLYWLNIFENLKIVGAAVSFFILLEFFRYSIQKRKRLKS